MSFIYLFIFHRKKKTVFELEDKLYVFTIKSVTIIYQSTTIMFSKTGFDQLRA